MRPALVLRLATGSRDTLTINCANQGLANQNLLPIFNQIPAPTPIDTIDLSNNTLNKIPAQILVQYTRLANVLMASNYITSLAPYDLNLTANAVIIDLSNNLITDIASNSLPSTIDI